MSLQTRLASLITEIGTDYKFLRSMITGSTTGVLTSLATTDKSSIIAAINEVKNSGSSGSSDYETFAHVKRRARVGSTSNVSPLSGTPVLSGIQTAVGDRILLMGQAVGSQNGLWEIPIGAGAWVRPFDFNTASKAAGATVAVLTGSLSGRIYHTTFNAQTAVIDSTAMVWYQDYSDANPPETLMFTDIATASVPTPTTGSILSTPDGRLLFLKDTDGVARPVDMSWENCPFSQVGTLTAKVGANRYPVKGGTFQIQTVAAMVGTAPTGASAIIDVNKNGTTIFTTQGNRPTIAVSTNSATVGAHTPTTVTDGDYLTVDVDQVGSTVAGSDLTVVVRMQRIA